MPQTGLKYGMLTVVSIHHNGREKRAICICECGKQKDIRLNHVVKGNTVSCGCVKRKHAVEPGKRYGRLIVQSLEYQAVKGHLKVPTICDCGQEKMVGVVELATGKTKSCGCLIIDKLVAMSTTHGGEGSALYSVWHTMKSRCLNPSTDSFKSYGGRGITICPEWLNDFAAFRDWAESNGYRSGLQIDRRDVNGNYTPDNCRWLTPRANGNNRRNNVMLTAFGEIKTMSQWSDDPRCAVSYATLKERVGRRHWDHEKAIKEPPARQAKSP